MGEGRASKVPTDPYVRGLTMGGKGEGSDPRGSSLLLTLFSAEGQERMVSDHG